MDGGQTDAVTIRSPATGPVRVPPGEFAVQHGRARRANWGTVFSHQRYAQCHWRFLFLTKKTLSLSFQTTIASGSHGRRLQTRPSCKGAPCPVRGPSFLGVRQQPRQLAPFGNQTPARYRKEALAVFYTVLTPSAN